MKSAVSSPAPYRYCLGIRAVVLCAGFVAVLTAISVRLIEIQHTRHRAVMAKVLEVSPSKKVIPAQRGDIQDRDLRPLATTRPVTDLRLNRHHVQDAHFWPEVRAIAVNQFGMAEEEVANLPINRLEALYYRMLASKLAAPLDREPDELFERLASQAKTMNLLIHKGLDSQMAHRLLEELDAQGFKGLHHEDRMARTYVSGNLAAHVVGYVNHDLVGVAGIEASMNSFLAGKDGVRVYDPQSTLLEEVLPEHGRHVVLTLDSTFQEIVERIVDKHFKTVRPQALTAIFAAPATGEILALVNRPGFTPADGGNADPKTWTNTAVSSVYEPGSTFKIVTHATAMDLGLVGLDTWVSCHNGHYREDNWSLHDSSSGRESAPVRDVIAFSLNTGTFMVAQQIKPLAFYEYMEKFGLGQKTGIRLPAEQSGLVPHPKKGWGRKRLELSRLAMGYNLNATPLQILGIMSVICNKGDLVKPRILRQLLSADGQQVTARPDSQIVKGVIGRRTAARLKDALVHAVQNGTGKQAQVEGYVVGGKTGTAEKLVNGRYGKNRNIASFLGFIGNEIDAALIGMVLVDDPQNDGNRYGGLIAAPIFQEIAEAGMVHFGVRRLDVVETENEP